MKNFLFILLCFPVISAVAQYAPQAGVTGSTAVSKSDNRFAGWATNCRLRLGWMHIEDKSLGMANIGDSSYAIGTPDNALVSLGDSGVAVLTFEAAIYNGEGPDFAVFENGFPNPANPEEAFLELAFVEVSSDGSNFTRFPASSLTDTPQVPMAGVYMNARKINNLAGKYIGNYGTPFDLQELAGTPGLDINNITHIRLIDVIGSITSVGTKDKDGNYINDPYPSPVPGSGFDLDAVGAFYIKGKYPSAIASVAKANVSVYPNPVAERLMIHTDKPVKVTVCDVAGRILAAADVTEGASIGFDEYRAGMYYINFTDHEGNRWVEKVTKL